MKDQSVRAFQNSLAIILGAAGVFCAGAFFGTLALERLVAVRTLRPSLTKASRSGVDPSALRLRF